MLPVIGTEGSDFVHGADDRPVFVRWRLPEAPRAAVLVLHGYSEHSGRYLHVLDAMAARGFAAIAPDHRGHGRTAIVPGDLESGTAVLSDLAVVHRHLLQAVPARPCFVFGHSMGGLLGLRMLALWGDAFAGAVINGAAMRVPDSIPRPVRLLARALARAAPTAPLQPFFNPRNNMRDPVRQQAMWDDPLVYKGRVRARTGTEAMRLIAEAWDGLHRVRLPVLLTHGGADTRVPPSVSRDILDGLGAVDKQLHVFDGLLHEPHNEPESSRVVATWLDWIEARVG